MFSQTTVCEGSPCTSNDFTVDNFFLGDEFGTPLDNGFCNPGDIIQTHLWVNFTANAAAPRYSLYLHFNLYYDGVFIETIDECYFNLMPIPIGVPLDTGLIDWECGTEISITGLYMSWQTNDSSPCDCSRSHCISEQILIVQTPLIASFEHDSSCETDFLVNFTSTKSGGVAPFTYLWDFGDGTTSNLENPAHTYTYEGPFSVILTVTDTNGVDSTETQIVSFESDNIPLIITPPANFNLEGCDTTILSPFNYSEILVIITEDEFNAMGGSIEYYTESVTLSYVDSSSGSCPIEITRTFNAVDSCNTTTSAIQTIKIIDTIPPTANNLPLISIQCIGDLPQANIDLVIDEVDNCSIPTVAFVSDTSNGQTCPETITRTYSITDECENSINISQTIIVNDTIFPTANSLNSIKGIQCITDIPQPDISLITNLEDNCTLPTVMFISDVSDNQTCPETITRTYRVSDECGNYIDLPQFIIIEDTIKPELTSTLDPYISVICGDLPEVPLLEFSDNCSTAVNVDFNETTTSMNTDSYTVIRTWTVSDNCGNNNNYTQEILVSITINDDFVSTNICVEDAPIDLNTFVTNTTILTGTWQSELPDILNGSLFNPKNVKVGSYEFSYSYTNDNSCVFKTIVNVGMNEDCVACIKTSTDAINISKLVTPNNDGNNDFLEVKYNIKNPNARLCVFSISIDIYNRWGTRVYSNPDYNNSWDGVSPKGSIGASNKLPTGTYYYIIKFNNTAEKTNPIQGYILLGSN